MNAHEEYERSLTALRNINDLVHKYSKTGLLDRDCAISLINDVSATHEICKKRKRVDADLSGCPNRVIVAELKTVSKLLNCELMMISAG